MHLLSHGERARTVLAALFLFTASASAQVRVACLGDSITFGQGAGETKEDAAYAAYPAVLGRLLGTGFQVESFGAPGHALRPDGPLAYGASKALESALAFQPDLAIVMLGTNDSHRDESGGDWGAPVAARIERLIAQLREAQPAMRVLLASPPTIFPEMSGLSEERRDQLRLRAQRLDAISEALRASAGALDGVEFVDVRAALRERDVTDGVHPNAFGAERLAYRLAGAVALELDTSSTPWSKLLERMPDATIGTFHGFDRADFSLAAEDSPACILVAPDRVAAGAPWVRRARFFGHEPALDRALLDRGFHLAYVDVAGLFGAPQAEERMERFQAFCESLGMGQRPILEGMGREGLAIVDSAGAHPEHVAPLLRGLLRAAGIHSAESDPSTWAAPSAEYRGSSAGWGGGTWRKAFESLQALAAASRAGAPMDVVFLGDSITQGLTGHTERLAMPDGERPFDRHQGERRAVSVGLSGDRTEHLLFRIAAGSLDGFRPRVIVLQIGINNINAASHTGAETFRGIVAVVDALHERFPETQIVQSGPFPAGVDPEGAVRQSVREVHELLAHHPFDERVRYLDLSALFVDEVGAPRETLGRDSLHITGKGQEAWMQAIEPTLRELLD